MASLKQIIEANGQSFEDIMDSDPESLLRTLCGDTTYLNQVDGVSLPQEVLDASEPKGNLFCIWGEENAALNANTHEMSHGNGATGSWNGVILAVDCELISTGISCQTFGTSISLNCQLDASTIATTTHTANSSLEVLPSPVFLAAGSRFAIQTGALVGDSSRATTVAWFREV